MRKKFLGFVVSMLVFLSSLTTIFVSNVGVEASYSNPDLSSNPLNMSYVWNWTNQLANITYSYHDGEIPRGRAYGSSGAILAKDKIINEMSNNLSLISPHPEKIQHIDGIPKYYTSVVNVTDFQFTINNPEYPYPHDVPINESFVIPRGFAPRTHDFEISEADIVLWNLTNPRLLGEFVDYSLLNITQFTPLNNIQFFVGNLTYLTEFESIPDSDEQQGRIYILDESSSIQNQLDGLMDASGCMIIDHNQNQIINTSQICYEVIKINPSAGLQLQDVMFNYSLVLADVEDGQLTIYYDITDATLPNGDYVIVDRIPTHEELSILYDWPYAGIGNYTWDFKVKTIALYWLDFFKPFSHCNAFILFSSFDQHLMLPATFTWNLEAPSFPATPAIPTFTINYTVGEFLANHHSTTTVSGHIYQEFEEETADTEGITAYNVVGYINPLNKEDKAVLSSRLDGWFGQTPGDSGCGNAIVLGIAKYIQDNNIKPKYNLTILFTTGEEYGLRGAEYYNDLHDEDPIKIWIVADQLAFNQTGTVQEISIQNASGLNHFQVLQALIQESQYSERTGYENYNHSGPIFGTEQAIFGSRANIDDVICIAKDYYYQWDRWHCTGNNYTEGDSLKYIDRNDLNISAELIWNFTKYFIINPDCGFENVVYHALDTLDDGDTLNDTIQANFTVETVLPNDKVMIKTYGRQQERETQYQYYGSTNFTIAPGQNLSINFTIPDSDNQGTYSIYLELYNSTGRLNDIYHLAINNVNDTSENSAYFELYHPLGSITLGENLQTAANNITGTVFTANEDAIADSIIRVHPDLEFVVTPPGNPHMKCMIYRASDGCLVGTTEEKDSLSGVFNFTNPKPYLVQGTDYILTLWADNTNSYLYYYDLTGTPRGRYYEHTYGTPPQQANFQTTQCYCSLYCSYTTYGQAPIINSVSNQPSIGGFGQDITITANVTEGDLPISGVNVTIQHLASIETYPMTHLSGPIYQYVYADGWTTGQYNYTVTAFDTQGHTNTSQQQDFTISADATISVSTLQDTYTDPNDYINLTDPPEIPEDYVLTSQGLTWNTYAAPDGDHNILETYTSPINYQDQTNTWHPINQTITTLDSNHPAYTYGYRTGNERGLYSTYFKPNFQDNWSIAFAYNSSQNPTLYTIRTKLIGVGYLDPTSSWDYHILQTAQNSQAQINDNIITYPGAFTGTDLTLSYGTEALKEELIMSNTTKAVLQSHPPSLYGLSNTDSYLVFLTKVDASNLDLYHAQEQINEDMTITDSGIDFKTLLGEIRCAMPLGEAYELNNKDNRQNLTFRIVHYNGETYILAGFKLIDLAEMTFPVVIDPSLTIYSSSPDGYITDSNANYNTAWSAASGTVTDSGTSIFIGQRAPGMLPTYGINRAFLVFDTTQIPSNAIIDSATLGLYKATDFSTTDFDITVQNGQPNYPHNPLATGDYNKNYYSGDGGTFNTASFTSGFNDLVLNSQGLSWINPKATTKLCLRSSRDIRAITPTGNEFVSITSNEFLGTGCQPRLVIEYRNQSKIKNTGTTDIKGYLLMQVEYNDPQSGWVVDTEVIDDTTPRTIAHLSQLGLDTIFNRLVQVSDLTHGDGTYRIYVAFTDPDGNILETNTGLELVATWQFSVDIS